MSEPMNNDEVNTLEHLRRERAFIIGAIQQLVNGQNDPNGTLIASYGQQLAEVSEAINAQN